jgi:hypothetical protein
LPTPSFSLPATRVNPLRGFLRPALRVTRIKARHDMDTPLPPLPEVRQKNPGRTITEAILDEESCQS